MLDTLKSWFLAALVVTLVVAAAWYVYYDVLKKDGVDCDRDIVCPERVCLEDQVGHYCSRHCQADSDCLEGWHCLRPPGTTGRGPSCLRPQPF